MNDEKKIHGSREESAETNENLPYEPPRILESARFEVVAQGCDYEGGNIACEPFTSGA